jgi:hypothetical protein
MADRDEADLEGTDLLDARCVDLDELGFYPELVEALARHAQRERRSVHRHVDLTQEPAQRSYVIFVSVRQHHGLAPVAPVGDVREVRQHEIYAEHLLGREREARVDDEDAAFGLDREHVAPDLANATKEDDANGLPGV